MVQFSRKKSDDNEVSGLSWVLQRAWINAQSARTNSTTGKRKMCFWFWHRWPLLKWLCRHLEGKLYCGRITLVVKDWPSKLLTSLCYTLPGRDKAWRQYIIISYDWQAIATEKIMIHSLHAEWAISQHSSHLSHLLISCCVTQVPCTLHSLNQSTAAAGSFSTTAPSLYKQHWSHWQVCWQAERPELVHTCSPAERCQEPQADTKQDETRDEVCDVQEVINPGKWEIFQYQHQLSSFRFYINASHTGLMFLVVESAMFKSKPGVTETGSDVNAAETLSLTLPHCPLYVKVRHSMRHSGIQAWLIDLDSMSCEQLRLWNRV